MKPLVAGLRRDVADDRSVLARRLVQALLRDAATSDEAGLAFTALAMQSGYSALEAILDRCVRFFDGGAPTGSDWHRSLVTRAGLDLPGIRPALLSQESVAVARVLLAFRHFLHHDYGAELDAPRLAALQAAVTLGRACLDRDLDALDAWLGALAQTP